MEAGEFEHLPTSLIPDLQRLYDFGWTAEDKLREPREFNVAKRIDTAITDALATVPRSTIIQTSSRWPENYEYNLVYRTLTRAQMVQLATGQQLADLMHLRRLTADGYRQGDGNGAVLDHLEDKQKKDELIAATPLWFYVLREAELNNGRLTGVGGRIVAEVFHRAMEGSRISILRDPFWRPSLVPENKPFRMVDLPALCLRRQGGVAQSAGRRVAPLAPPESTKKG